jgi:hypothetical protein
MSVSALRHATIRPGSSKPVAALPRTVGIFSRPSRPMPLLYRVLAGLMALFLALTMDAQVVGGTISGVITDSSGAALPGAAVLVHNDETGNERKLVTGPDGRYSAPSIPVGVYTVSANHEGFAEQRRSKVGLTVGQSTAVDLTLGVSGASEQITVEGSGSLVNQSTEQTAGLVDERQIKDLPLNGRSYDQLITLNPATVNYTAQRSGSVGTSNSSVGNMFSVSGRRPQDNLYLLNGIEYTGASLINVTPGGTSGQLLGVDAVREFNVVSDSYSASYGKRQGAQVSIVTAGGTNALHGSVYEFLRNSFFDARNFFDQARIPEFQRNNFGGSLGGPIRKDKLFLFANYESYRQNLGITDVTLVPDANARQGLLPNAKTGALQNVGLAAGVAPLLNLWPVANGPELTAPGTGFNTGIAEAFSSPTQHIREDFGTTRFDANLTANDLFFAVYTVDDSMAHTPTQNPLSLIDESLREQVLSAQEQHVFSARLLNTARVGFSRANFYFLGSSPVSGVPGFIPSQPVGAIVIAGSTASNGASQITGAGGNVGSNNGTTRNLFTFDDHIFYTRGRHQIEAGGWVQRLQSNDNLAQNQFGQASFASLTTFLQGTVKTFTVVPNPTQLGWRSTMGAAYVEDTVKLTNALELRAGLRFESTNGWNESQGRAGIYGFTNDIINTNPTVGSSALTDNRAKFLPEPRVGLAYSPFPSGKTAIRAAFGMHHSLLDNLDYRLDQAAPYNTTLSYSGVPIANPTGGAAGLISPSNVQPDIQTPTVISYTLKVEQQIAPSTTLTLAYIGSHGYHQILSEDQNEPAFVTCPNPACPSTLASGVIYYPTITKANPLVANTTSWISGGSSNYNGAVVDLRRAFAHGLQLRANYTFSKNLDNGSAWNTSVSANTPAFVSVPQLPRLDYGPAATDIRHLFAVNGSYELPVGTGKLFLANAGPAFERIVSGFSLSTIANLQTGFPFTPQLGYNPTGSGDTRNPVRPDINPSFHGAILTQGTTSQRAAQFFNPAAYQAPAYGAVGNLGRDTLTGPGFADWDLSLLKTTQISERTRLQFRAEFFNLLNHTSLLTPNAVIASSGPTQGAASSQTTAAVASPTAGVVTAAATSRQIQLGLKLLF